MDDINNNKKGSPDKVTTDQSINSEDEGTLTPFVSIRALTK